MWDRGSTDWVVWRRLRDVGDKVKGLGAEQLAARIAHTTTIHLRLEDDSSDRSYPRPQLEGQAMGEEKSDMTMGYDH